MRKYGVRLVSFALFAIFLSLLPAPNVYFQSVPSTYGIALPKAVDFPPPPPYPVNNTGIKAPDLTAKAVFVKDVESGVTLLAKNEHTKLPTASTAKIVTALVGLDYYHLDDILTVKTVLKEGQTINLIQGERLTFESLLYGALVHSGNDAAYTIAENYPGGVESFVKAMNEKAKLLSLEDSHYTNPTGLDDSRQYTSAYDLALQAQAGLTNTVFSKIVSTRSISISDVDYTRFHELKNVNELLGRIPGMSGVKTGFTDMAGEILVSEVKKNGHTVIFVVLNSTDRFGETKQLVDWVFGNISWVDFNELLRSSSQ